MGDQFLFELGKNSIFFW